MPRLRCFCGKITDITCTGCGTPVCSGHAGYIRRGFWCADCFTKTKSKGTLIAWIAVASLVVVAIAVVAFS